MRRAAVIVIGLLVCAALAPVHLMTYHLTQVPEPTTFGLMGLGIAAVVLRQLRRT